MFRKRLLGGVNQLKNRRRPPNSTNSPISEPQNFKEAWEQSPLLEKITVVSAASGGVVGFIKGVSLVERDEYGVVGQIPVGLISGGFCGCFGAFLGALWPITGPMAIYYSIKRTHDPC